MAWFQRAVQIFRPNRLDRELSDEMRFHLQMREQQNIEAGMSPVEAHEDALKTFGNLSQKQEQAREADTLPWLETLWQDLRYGFRTLARQPGFTAVVILTLAIGIGANVAIFSVLDAVLLRPLPYSDSGRIVMIWHIPPQNTRLGSDFFPWGENQVREFSSARTLEHLAAFKNASFNLTGGETIERVDGLLASAELLPILGVQPALGRFFNAEEDRPGAGHVVVLSDAVWRQLGADPKLPGKSVSINAEPYTVVGVMPPGFAFPHGTDMPGNFQFPAEAQLWVPLQMKGAAPRGAPDELVMIGKLKTGHTLGEASAEFGSIGKHLEELNPRGWFESKLVPLHEQVVGNARQGLALLSGAVGLLLLITCANVSNLVLARSLSRTREFSLRAALGAGRRRLVRQLLTENLMLAIAGGLLGVALAAMADRMIILLGAGKLPRIAEVRMDGWVLAYSLILSCCASLLFGLWPALRLSKINLADALKSGGRVTGGDRSQRVQATMVICEVALSVVLLAGAGLLIHSFAKLTRVDSGFRPASAVTFELTLPSRNYPTQDARREVLRKLLQALAQQPGIQSAALVQPLPMSGSQENTVFEADGYLYTGVPTNRPMAEYTIISSDYFRSMGIPILQGRSFSDSDDAQAHGAIIVSKALADFCWPGQDAIGKPFRLPVQKEWSTVVGVAADVNRFAIGETPRLEMYVHYRQWVYPVLDSMQFVVRTPMAVASAAHSLRAAVMPVDAGLPLAKVRPMQALVAEAMTPARFSMLLLACFGALGVLLAALGVYGLMSHAISLQMREIAVRMAIGASPSQILSLVLGRGMRLVAGGSLIGIVAALVLTRGMRTLLFGVAQNDPITYALALLTLFSVAALSCYLPARRAARVQPMDSLRLE
jgi:putative ABC transport system permease protein